MTAEATPAWVPGMAATPAAVAGEMDRPSPAPTRASFHHSWVYGVPGSIAVRAHSPAPPSSSPAVTGTR
jgi:hypothetical protein